MNIRRTLLGLNEELDRAVRDVGIFGSRYAGMHPAAGGDVSQVLSAQESLRLVKRFKKVATQWFALNKIETLAQIRNDGRSGYRSEGIGNPRFYNRVEPLSGRVMLITSTGSQLPGILEAIRFGEDGKLLNLIEIGREGKSVRILYGNREFGTIPSIELHVHMLACGVSMQEGMDTPAAVHAHPYHLILLGMQQKLVGSSAMLNAILYGCVEGLNRNVPNLIGTVPYEPSGSAALLTKTITPITKHELVLWLNHGVIARSLRIERAYALITYAEQAARVGLDVLRHGGKGLPLKEVEHVLKSKKLFQAFKRLGLG